MSGCVCSNFLASTVGVVVVVCGAAVMLGEGTPCQAAVSNSGRREHPSFDLPSPGRCRKIVFLAYLFFTFWHPCFPPRNYHGITFLLPFPSFSQSYSHLRITFKSPCLEFRQARCHLYSTFKSPLNHLEAEVNFAQEKSDSKVTYPVAGQL